MRKLPALLKSFFTDRLSQGRQKGSLFLNVLLSGFTGVMTIVNNIIVFIIIGRLLTVEDFGIVSLAITVSTVAALVPGYGFEFFAIRGIAQKIYNPVQLINSILPVKLILSVLSWLGLGWYLQWSAASVHAEFFWLVAIAATMATFSSLLNAVQKAENDFVPEAITNAIQSLSLVGFLLFFMVSSNLSLMQVSLSFLLSRVLALSYAGLRFRYGKKSKLLVQNDRKVHFRAILALSWQITVEAFPFALQAVLGLLYFQIDTIIMAEFLDLSQIAFYQAALRLVVTSMLIANVIISAFYPRIAQELSRNNSHGTDFLNARLLLETLLIIGGLVTVIFYIGAPIIITILYGSKMAPASTVFQILSLVVITRYVAGTYGLILMAAHHQQIQVIGAATAIIVNVAINLFLIPSYGYIAAAWVSVITNILVLTIYVFFMKRYLGTFMIWPNKLAIVHMYRAWMTGPVPEKS